MGCKVKNIEKINRKYVVTLDSDVHLDRSKRYLDNNMFISDFGLSSNRFAITKLGSTNNPSVVFSLKYNNGCDPETGLNSLINELKKYM